MTKTKDPIRYEIDSLERLVNLVNKENIDRISIDLLLWLNYLADFVDKFRAENPKLKDKSNWELFRPTFTWIDDGKNEIDHVKITNEKTGEVTEVKLK